MSNNDNLFPTLGDDILVHIVEYLNLEEALEAAEVCKQFHRCVEKASTAALTRIDQEKNVDEDFWLRLRQHFNDNDQRRPISLSMLLTPPARILLKAARTIPMKQLTTQHYGGLPALLPDGNIAICCSESDGLIRILDKNTFQFSVCEEREQGVQIETDSWWALLRLGIDEGRRLFYSNGHLVLARSDDFLVWELEYDTRRRIHAIHFRRQVHALNVIDAWAVAENGKIYILRHQPQHQQEQIDQLIEVHDIATGEHLHTKLCNNIPLCQSLLLTEKHLLLIRHRKRDDGIYAFDIENDLSQTSSLSDFGVHGIEFILQVAGIHINRFILYYDFTDNSFRVISIDGHGTLRVRHQDDADIPLGLRQDAGIPLQLQIPGQWPSCSFGSATARVFLVIDQGADSEMKIEEFDMATGRKMRTLSTGAPARDDYLNCYTLSNDTAVFCMIKTDHFTWVIQSFLV